MLHVTDKNMERVYRLTSVMGHKRAIQEVAGQRFNEETDEFEPFTELADALTERYNREMTEFVENGGY